MFARPKTVTVHGLQKSVRSHVTVVRKQRKRINEGEDHMFFSIGHTEKKDLTDRKN